MAAAVSISCLLGFRGGDPIKGDCPFCTDTLILLTVDPTTKTAGMLSIPRDMWVNIPGFGYSRINTAWTLGRGSKLPGGGPALTMKTVSHFIGVPIDYYVQVDFDTFVDIINLLGGVDVYNEETIVLDPMAHGKDFPKVKITCCGMRHLDGRTALAYSRCRHIEQGCQDGDIGRARRQQKVIFGIRDKVLNPENFSRLLAQAPQLYNVFSDGIHTNLSLQDAIKLAVLARDISTKNIRNAVIDNTMLAYDNVILGGKNASIMKPLPDKIRVLRDEVFTSSGPLGPLAQGDPISLMQADEATGSCAEWNLHRPTVHADSKLFITARAAGNRDRKNKSSQPNHDHSLFAQTLYVKISRRSLWDYQYSANPHPTGSNANSGHRDPSWKGLDRQTALWRIGLCITQKRTRSLVRFFHSLLFTFTEAC